MGNNVDAYKHGSFYEIFIHRALRNSDTSKPGTHGSIIQNLISVEEGNTAFVKWHGTFEKQLSNAKKHMFKAIDKYLKMKRIPSESKERLEIIKSNIDRANSSVDLMDAIYETLELTQCVKDY